MMHNKANRRFSLILFFKLFVFYFLLAVGLSFLFEDRVAAFRMKELLDIASESFFFPNYGNTSADFQWYANYIHYSTFGLHSFISNTRLVCAFSNSIWTSLAFCIFDWKVCRLNILLLTTSKLNILNFASLYCIACPSLLFYISSSLRDTFVFGIILILASLLSINKFKFSIAYNLFCVFLLYVLYKTRPEMLPISVVSLGLLFSRNSISSFVANVSSLVSKLLSFRLPAIKISISKSIILVLFISLAFAGGAYSLSRLTSLAKINPSSIFDSIDNYQVARISRNDTSTSSNSDILANTDEFKNTPLSRRILLQFTNLVITPLRFKFNPIQLITLFDSILSIYLIFRLIIILLKKSRCNSHISAHTAGSRSSLDFLLSFSLISLMLFSLIISNGGNAFRYKQHWVIYLILYLVSNIKISERTTSRRAHASV